MNQLAARRLRFIGLAALALVLLLVLSGGGRVEKIDLATLLTTLLVAGIGLLVLSEVAPFIQSFRAGDMEMTFMNVASDKFLGLEQRVAKLEQLAEMVSARTETEAAPAAQKPPVLERPAERPQIKSDDVWKGRFGGKSEDDGFKLRAEFRNLTSNFVEIVMIVEAMNVDLPSSATAEFYLHQSFEPNNIIPAGFRNGRAEVSVIAYGGFTVGVWLPWKRVELELDLAEVKGAPRIVKEL